MAAPSGRSYNKAENAPKRGITARLARRAVPASIQIGSNFGGDRNRQFSTMDGRSTAKHANDATRGSSVGRPRRGRRAVLGNWMGRKERKDHREGWRGVAGPAVLSGRDREGSGGILPPGKRWAAGSRPSRQIRSVAFFAVSGGNLPDEPVWAVFGGKKWSKIDENGSKSNF